MHTDCILIIAFSITSLFFLIKMKVWFLQFQNTNSHSVLVIKNFAVVHNKKHCLSKGSTLYKLKDRKACFFYSRLQLKDILHRLVIVFAIGHLLVKPICWQVPQWVKREILGVAVRSTMSQCFSPKIISVVEDHAIHLCFGQIKITCYNDIY